MVVRTIPRYSPLPVDALTAALRDLPEWGVDGCRLVRTVRPRDLWGLLEQVCEVERELDHHTEVTLEAGSVTFALWTHVRNAVTAADLELARRLDALLGTADRTNG
jgi:4a-hydroxytetrahydrobiopterin dehydratase